MLEGRDLLFFGGDWDRFQSGVQQIADVLARSNRVLWVGSVSIRRPRFHVYDVRRITGRILDLVNSKRHESHKKILTSEIYPIVIPFYDFYGVKSINDTLLRRVLLKRMTELRFKDVIAFPTTPMVAGLVGTLGESSSHYICMDDYTQYDGAYSCVASLEKTLLERVDSCFALSDPLLQTRKAKTGENHYLPMGVDIDFFTQEGLPLPEELKSIKKPIAGFFGQIGTYVDIDLIAQCARAYPEVSFVVMGKPQVNVNMSVLSRSKNIFFLGEIPYNLMPSYAQSFDIGLNPRVVNGLSLAMNPVKLLEYLSRGMPVVSTDIPAVRKFKDYVYIADSREHFVQLVGEALKDTSSEKRQARKDLAKKYSWKAIVEDFSTIIGRIDAAKRA